MMNPSTCYSDWLNVSWHVARKRALCERSFILTVPNAFKSLATSNSGQVGVSYFGDRRSQLQGSADNARVVQHSSFVRRISFLPPTRSCYSLRRRTVVM